MPNSLHAQMMRRAISPRLAIRIFWNMGARSYLAGPDGEQRLSVLDRASVFDQLGGHHARHFGLDLVHQFHGFDDAEDLAGLDGIAYVDESRGARGGSVVVRSDDGRFH